MLKKREQKGMTLWQKASEKEEKNEIYEICRKVQLNVKLWSNQEDFKKMRKYIEEKSNEEIIAETERVKRVKYLKTQRQADFAILENDFQKLNQNLTKFYIDQESKRLNDEVQTFIIQNNKEADNKISKMKEKAEQMKKAAKEAEAKRRAQLAAQQPVR